MSRHTHESQLQENDYKLKQQAYARILQLRKQLREAESQFQSLYDKPEVQEPEVRMEIAKTYDSLTGQFKDILVPKADNKKKNPNRLVNGNWT